MNDPEITARSKDILDGNCTPVAQYHANHVRMPKYEYQKLDNRTGSVAYREPTAPPQPAPDALREAIIKMLAEKFPSTFTPYGSGKTSNALASNVADAILSLLQPGAAAVEDER